MKVTIEVQVGGPITDLKDLAGFLNTLINATGQQCGNFRFDEAHNMFRCNNDTHGLIVAEAGLLYNDSDEAEAIKRSVDATAELVGARIAVHPGDVDKVMYNAISAVKNGTVPKVLMADGLDGDFREVSAEKPRHLHLVKEPEAS